MNMVSIAVILLAEMLSCETVLLNLMSVHQYHVSKCQVAYDTNAKSIHISLHIFIDDLEEALRRKGVHQINIGTAEEALDANARIYEYIQGHLKIKLDNNIASYKFTGKEESHDLQGLWCFLEIAELNPFAVMSVTNDILMEIYDDQKNIVSIIADKKVKGYFLFTIDNITEQLSLVNPGQ